MKTKILYPLMVAGLFLSATPSYAADASHNKLINSLESRIKALEAINRTNKKVPVWSDKIAFAGLIELEAGYLKDYTDISSSDLVIATVQLGIQATINENISSEIVFLYEEDDTYIILHAIRLISLLSYNHSSFVYL